MLYEKHTIGANLGQLGNRVTGDWELGTGNWELGN